MNPEYIYIKTVCAYLFGFAVIRAYLRIIFIIIYLDS